MGILCCNVLGKSFRICEIPIDQNKALKTPLYVLYLPTPKEHIPQRGLNTGAKVQKKYDIYKFIK